MEMTRTGKALGKITTLNSFKYLKPAWGVASKRFAKGTKGEVHVFRSAKGFRPDSILATIEFPILKRQGNAINYQLVE